MAKLKLPSNKTIFFMWLQGIENAPPVVQACYSSWVRMNPGWTVQLLDSATIRDFVALPEWAESKLTHAQYSDLARLHLLEAHGGVWADSTTYCNWPLDGWLSGAYGSGFFAFAWPNKGYELSSWFMAAEPSHPLVVGTRGKLEPYWQATRRPMPGWLGEVLGKVLVRVLRQSTRLTAFWFSRPIVWMRLYPYFAIHYAFAEVARTNSPARDAWCATPKISSDGPHLLQEYGLSRRPDSSIRREIAEPTTPMYKLTWKVGDADSDADSSLSLLLRTAREAERYKWL